MEIYLRPITIDDGKLIVKWRNSPNVLKHCLNKEEVTIESNKRFFEENVETGRYLQFIVEKSEEQSGAACYPIATVYLKDIDKFNKMCELCIFTSDDSEWGEEAQIIAVNMLVKKAFDELGMHKVYSYAFYNFLDEADMLRKAGFSIEAILREEAIGEKGRHEDVVRFCIFNDSAL